MIDNEKELLREELRDTKMRLESILRCYEKCIDVLEKENELIASFEEERSHTIDKDHALKLMSHLLESAGNDIEKGLFVRFKGLIEILPTSKQLDAHVYCSECANCIITEDDMSCSCGDKCYFVAPEDSAPLRLRWLYARKVEKEKEND